MSDFKIYEWNDGVGFTILMSEGRIFEVYRGAKSLLVRQAESNGIGWVYIDQGLPVAFSKTATPDDIVNKLSPLEL